MTKCIEGFFVEQSPVLKNNTCGKGEILILHPHVFIGMLI